MSGVISERDYITKIALLGRTSKETKIKEVSTRSAKLVTAKLDDTVESCMEKMLNRVSLTMLRLAVIAYFCCTRTTKRVFSFVSY
jgi:CBS domain-containing protein